MNSSKEDPWNRSVFLVCSDKQPSKLKKAKGKENKKTQTTCKSQTKSINAMLSKEKNKILCEDIENIKRISESMCLKEQCQDRNSSDLYFSFNKTKSKSPVPLSDSHLAKITVRKQYSQKPNMNRSKSLSLIEISSDLSEPLFGEEIISSLISDDMSILRESKSKIIDASSDSLVHSKEILASTPRDSRTSKRSGRSFNKWSSSPSEYHSFFKRITGNDAVSQSSKKSSRTSSDVEIIVGSDKIIEISDSLVENNRNSLHIESENRKSWHSLSSLSEKQTVSPTSERLSRTPSIVELSSLLSPPLFNASISIENHSRDCERDFENSKRSLMVSKESFAESKLVSSTVDGSKCNISKKNHKPSKKKKCAAVNVSRIAKKPARLGNVKKPIVFLRKLPSTSDESTTGDDSETEEETDTENSEFSEAGDNILSTVVKRGTEGRRKLFTPRRDAYVKDSFLASEASSDDSYSPTLYHRAIADDIVKDFEELTLSGKKFKETNYKARGKPKKFLFDESDEMSAIPSDDDSSVKSPRHSLCISSKSASGEKSTDFLPPSSPVIENRTHTKVTVSDREYFPVTEKRTPTNETASDEKYSPSSFATPVRVIKTISKPKDSVAKSTGVKSTVRVFKIKGLDNVRYTPNASEKKLPPLSFLQSLNASVTHENRIHPEALKYKKKFNHIKEELGKKLYDLFNKEVFASNLPNDMTIEWNPRLRRTAGRCHNTRIFGDDKKIRRITRKIELSSKVIETPDRLRDVMIHEMCHSANWILDGQKGHGYAWKLWTLKAMEKFPEIPLIKTCHNYSISTKFTYQCVKCGCSFGRHSKSVDLNRKRCGRCLGQFEVFRNYANGEKKRINKEKENCEKPLTKWAQFVRENFAATKKENPEMKHKEIMKLLANKCSEKNNN